MTAVAGRCDPHRPICVDDGSEEQYIREQESFGDGPFDVYLHGNLDDDVEQDDEIERVDKGCGFIY